MFDLRLLLLSCIACLSIVTRAPAQVTNSATPTPRTTNSATPATPSATSPKPQSPAPSATPATPTTSATPTVTTPSPTPETKNQPPNQFPPVWLWWTTIVLVPVGTITGLWLGRRQKPDLPSGKIPSGKRLASDTDAFTDELIDEAEATEATDENNDQAEAINAPPASAPLPSRPSRGDQAHTSTDNTSTDNTSTDISPTPLSKTTRLSKVDIVETLIADLRSPDAAKRRKAIWELGQRADSRAMQPLVEIIVDADSQQRSLILAAISEIGIRTLNPINRALLVSLQDDSATVRQNAIRDVTRIYDLIAQISQLLQLASSDQDTEVRETATWALNQLHKIRTTSQTDGQVNRQAMWDDRQSSSALPPSQED